MRFIKPPKHDIRKQIVIYSLLNEKETLIGAIIGVHSF